MSDDFALQGNTPNTTETPRRKRGRPSINPDKQEDNRQVLLRMSPELLAEIDRYMADLTPAMRAKIDAATMREDGRPHENPRQAFAAYAIRRVLTAQEKSRPFGTKIDEFVETVMARNLEVHEQRPENWWELQAITRSFLTSPEAGHNPNSVKRWLEENKERIDAHHKEIGITDPTEHNRKAGKARKALANESL